VHVSVISVPPWGGLARPSTSCRPATRRAPATSIRSCYPRPMSSSPYAVDPDDPRAPPQARWDAMSADERRAVLASLPSEIARTAPPEGDEHQLPKERAKLTLREYFRRRGRSVYLGAELPIYDPGEAMFAPDLI